MLVHHVNESAAGVGPIPRASPTEGVVGVALEVGGSRIKIRIASQRLSLAVDEKLIGGAISRDVGGKDSVAIRLPLRANLETAADDDLFAGSRGVSDGSIFRT
jgi:hypothetical protein